MMLDKMSWECYQGTSLSYRVDQWEQHLVIGLAAKGQVYETLSISSLQSQISTLLVGFIAVGSGSLLNYQVSSDL